MLRARHVGERLVDGDALDERREIAKHLDGGIAQPLVFLEMAADKDELRTKLARRPSRHPAVDSEGSGFIGSGKHDPAADGDRLAAQRRVEHLLDRGVERVEIRMQNGGQRFHPEVDPMRLLEPAASCRSDTSRLEHKENSSPDCQAPELNYGT